MQSSENPKAQVAQIKEEQKEQYCKYSPQSTKSRRKIKKQTRRRSQTIIIHNCVIFECKGPNVERRVISQAVFNALTRRTDNLEDIIWEIVRKSDAKVIDEYAKERSIQQYKASNNRCFVKLQGNDGRSLLEKRSTNGYD